jgi:thioredoxin reductase (NADPH)
MSQYLIQRIAAHPAIEMLTETTLVELRGEQHLEQVVWRCHRDGTVEDQPIRHVFIMTGATPSTDWLDGCVALDAKGFILTGADVTTSGWPLDRSPFLLEASLPGVFAVGDVRAGNVKRVASAVGEGSTAVSFVHEVLQASK